MIDKNLSYDVALTSNGKILRECAGEVLRFASNSSTIQLSLEDLQHILEYPIVKPSYRISVCFVCIPSNYYAGIGIQ